MTTLTPIQKAQAAAAAAAKKKSSQSSTIKPNTLQTQQQLTTPIQTNNLPHLRIKASPLDDNDAWTARLREEYTSLIKYVSHKKSTADDWFTISSDTKGIKWTGSCWHYHESLRYEFHLEFEIPVSYPATNPEICLPELEGKTAKMYRGGKICLDDHFTPLWNRNVPKFGIVHVLALGLGPWLAAEVPDLVAKGLIVPKN